MEGYIYLGEYYDLLGRELDTTDKKIGKVIALLLDIHVCEGLE